MPTLKLVETDDERFLFKLGRRTLRFGDDVEVRQPNSLNPSRGAFWITATFDWDDVNHTPQYQLRDGRRVSGGSVQIRWPKQAA